MSKFVQLTKGENSKLATKEGQKIGISAQLHHFAQSSLKYQVQRINSQHFGCCCWFDINQVPECHSLFPKEKNHTQEAKSVVDNSIVHFTVFFSRSVDEIILAKKNMIERENEEEVERIKIEKGTHNFLK